MKIFSRVLLCLMFGAAGYLALGQTRFTVNQSLARQNNQLQFAVDAVAHSYDHYGQMVEYLRMNGIVPPSSRR